MTRVKHCVRDFKAVIAAAAAADAEASDAVSSSLPRSYHTEL